MARPRSPYAARVASAHRALRPCGPATLHGPSSGRTRRRVRSRWKVSPHASRHSLPSRDVCTPPLPRQAPLRTTVSLSASSSPRSLSVCRASPPHPPSAVAWVATRCGPSHSAIIHTQSVTVPILLSARAASPLLCTRGGPRRDDSVKVPGFATHHPIEEMAELPNSRLVRPAATRQT